MRQTIQILLLSVWCCYPLSAQSDCSSATIDCGNGPLVVFQESSLGTEAENLVEGCDISPFSIETETNPYWVRYEFSSDGTFTFTITPGSDDIDIDFYLFESDKSSCGELTSIRCMLTGENVGSNTDPACLGPTGLSEGSTDVVERPGCQTGDDNFLAPLEVKGGDVYYLLIQNFSASGMDDFRIDHGGTAERSCAVTSTAEANAKAANDIVVSPNPFAVAVNIQFLHSSSAESDIVVVDLYGHVVTPKAKLIAGELDLSYLSAGIYFLVITNNIGATSIHKIIKL